MPNKKPTPWTLLLICAMLINPAYAAIIVVNNDQDLFAIDGNCDLRDAINSANVNFSIDGCNAGEAGVSDLIIVQVPGPIQLAGTLPVFSSMLIGTNFGVDPIEVIAAPDLRHMRVVPISSNDNDFAITNFKFTGGHATEQNTGGAIYFNGQDVNFGDIELTSMIFENNHAYQGGAVHFDETNADTLRVYNNIYTNNTAESSAGALAGYKVVKAGAGHTIDILRSHFEDNATEGTAGAVFLRNEAAENISINDNKFISNSAVGSIGAMSLGAVVDTQTFETNRNLYLFNQAGGSSGALQVSFSSTVYVRESLFAFNSAQRGGAVTSVLDDSLLRMNSSTLVHNSASIAGDNIYIYATGRLIPSRNIIAYPGNGDNCFGSLGTTPAGNIRSNITDDDSCELLTTVPGTLQIDPQLSGLSSQPDTYPGLMPTFNSPAIDSTEFCGDLDLMERIRPEDGDGDGFAFCDIGAIEAPEDTDLLWSDSFGL